MKRISIGRNNGNDVVISDPFVSGTHLEIVCHDDGSYVLRDLGSSNGTFVNGSKVSNATLAHNDIVRIGDTVLPWQTYFNRQQEHSAQIIRQIRFGRGTENDIIISDPFVSSSHAILSILQNNEVLVEDSGSTNGSFVNDIRISRTILRSGDRLRFGHTEIHWEQYIHTQKHTAKQRSAKKTWLLPVMITVAVLFLAAASWGVSRLLLRQPADMFADTTSVEEMPVGELADVVAYAEKAVFLIETKKNDWPVSYGTGFFVSADGIAVTNSHVLQGGDSWMIKTIDGRFFRITDIIVNNTRYDYAIIRVDLKGNLYNYLKGAAANPRKGEEIIVIGNPKGIESTLSKGVVAGFRGGTEDEIMQGNFADGDTYIQIDVAVSPGSSGSPVMTRDGSVIGIATLSFEQANCVNCNFAVNFRLMKNELQRYTGQQDEVAP